MAGIKRLRVFTDSEYKRMQFELRRWFLKNRRPLPWRRIKTVYATVVSEFMCQQTQIDTVIPYFERWMKRFPDFNELASAQETEVLKYWEGLGYYRRARNLQRIAKDLAEGDYQPKSLEGWKKLPGIGEYTAAAIASICHKQAVAVVDGNVVRVGSRLHALDQPFKNAGEAAKAVRPMVDAMLHIEHPGDHNEAMMELGATICRKSKPQCNLCPLQSFCRGRGLPQLEQIPAWNRVKSIRVELNRAWIESGSRILLHRINDSSSSLQGLYEIPLVESVSAATPLQPEPFAEENRAIGNRRITEKFFLYQIEHHWQPPADFIWTDHTEIEKITLSGPHRKWVRKFWR